MRNVVTLIPVDGIGGGVIDQHGLADGDGAKIVIAVMDIATIVYFVIVSSVVDCTLLDNQSTTLTMGIMGIETGVDATGT